MARSIQHYQDTMEYVLSLNIGVEKYFSYIVIKSIFSKPLPDLHEFFSAVE